MLKPPFLSLPNWVRQSSHTIAQEARQVRIDYTRLNAFAKTCELPEPQLSEADLAHHYFADAEQTATAFLLLDTINFGSGYFHCIPAVDHSQYYAVAQNLKAFCAEQSTIDIAYFTDISIQSCCRIFIGHESKDPSTLEWMSQFSQALQSFAQWIEQHYAKRVTHLIEAAGHSASRLAELLSEIPKFNDIATYRGQAAPFYKRAQIAVWDIYLAFSGKGLGHFDDIQNLTIFADNALPHFMRMEGILKYVEPLEQAIDSGQWIAAGSEAEVELRACTIEAAEQLCKSIGPDAYPAKLDQYLWNVSHEPQYQTKPKHKTQTYFY